MMHRRFDTAVHDALDVMLLFLSFRIESIDKMESDFKNCHMFLVTILNKAVCRGSFPHRESAAGFRLLRHCTALHFCVFAQLIQFQFCSNQV